MIKLHISSFNLIIIAKIFLHSFFIFIIIFANIQDPVFGQGWEGPQKVPAVVQVSQSLLSGTVTDAGTSKKRCLAIKDGVLKMEIKERTGDFAMCCVNLDHPVEVKTGDELSAVIVLEKSEDEFHVKVETEDGQQIYLHRASLDEGESPVLKITLDKSVHLGGREPVRILRFCIAAKGPGKLQTVKASRAIISSLQIPIKR